MKLDSILIKNFQSHKNSELKFVDGVNVIIGPSDAGKSAVFRALNWALTNRPLGDAFRSEWGGDTLAQIKFGDNILQRFKNKNHNYYDLNSDVYKAFGSEPPEEIQTALAMDEVNIQSQTDPPFLLTSSPGETAQLLNKAASIDNIDFTVRNIKKGHDQLKRDLNAGEKWLKEQKEQLQEYENIPELEKCVQEVEQIEQARNNASKQRARIYTLLSKIYQIQEGLQTAQNIDVVEKHYNQAKKIKNTLDAKRAAVKKLANVVRHINKASEEIERADSKIIEQSKAYEELMPDECPLCGHVIDKEHNNATN